MHTVMMLTNYYWRQAMYNMNYDIQIGKYKLGLLESVEIHKSVDLLTDTAVIVVPGVVNNQPLNVEDKIQIGDSVTIKLGYNDDLKIEFEGFLQRIDTDENSLTFNCEDGIYLTRQSVNDKQFTNATVSQIAQYCLSEIGMSELNCTYDITFQKFVIVNANMFDVLKKLQDDTMANIYMNGKELNIHPPYIEKGGDVYYDFAKNIETADLKYRSKENRKLEVVVIGVGLDGKKQTVTVGTTGGEKRTIHVSSPMSDDDLKKRGESELQYLVFEGYEGSITSWLIPYVVPTFSAHIHDQEHEYKTGVYYVISVTTTFDENGAVRKVELGRKLA